MGSEFRPAKGDRLRIRIGASHTSVDRVDGFFTEAANALLMLSRAKEQKRESGHQSSYQLRAPHGPEVDRPSRAFSKVCGRRTDHAALF